MDLNKDMGVIFFFFLNGTHTDYNLITYTNFQNIVGFSSLHLNACGSANGYVDVSINGGVITGKRNGLKLFKINNLGFADNIHDCKIITV